MSQLPTSSQSTYTVETRHCSRRAATITANAATAGGDRAPTVTAPRCAQPQAVAADEAGENHIQHSMPARLGRDGRAPRLQPLGRRVVAPQAVQQAASASLPLSPAGSGTSASAPVAFGQGA